MATQSAIFPFGAGLVKLHVIDDDADRAAWVAKQTELWLSVCGLRVECKIHSVPLEDGDGKSLRWTSGNIWEWCKTFQSEEGLHSTTDQIIAVNANLSSATGRSRRTQRSGIDVVKWLRTDYQNRFASFIYSFESADALCSAGLRSVQETAYLLIRKFPECHLFVRLPDIPPPAVLEFPDEAKRKQIAQQVLRREIGIYHRTYRHSYNTLLAALRLLLGAIQAGDIDKERGLALLKTLDEQARAIKDISPSSANTYCEELLDLWRPIWERRQHNLRLKRVLLIDDMAGINEDSKEQQGWATVLQAILKHLSSRTCKLDVALNWQEAEGKIVSETEGNTVQQRYDLVILDYLFNNDDTDGITALREIKRRQPDLPVLFMTVWDDHEAVRSALQEGAFAFYAKELDDRNDRDSLNYYRKFRQLLQTVPPSDDRLRVFRQRYARIRNAVKVQDAFVTTQPGWTDQALNPVGDYLDHAFFLAESSKHDSVLKALFPQKDPAIVAALFHAVETMLCRVVRYANPLCASNNLTDLWSAVKTALIWKDPSVNQVKLQTLVDVGPRCIHRAPASVEPRDRYACFDEALICIKWSKKALAGYWNL